MVRNWLMKKRNEEIRETQTIERVIKKVLDMMEYNHYSTTQVGEMFDKFMKEEKGK